MDQCQTQYLTLLLLLKGRIHIGVTPAEYMYELEHTKHCDQYYSLKEVREMIHAYTGVSPTERILARRGTKDDNYAAKLSLIHYQYFLRSKLLEGLTPWNWLKYHGWLAPREALAAMGFGSGVLGGPRN